MFPLAPKIGGSSIEFANTSKFIYILLKHGPRALKGRKRPELHETVWPVGSFIIIFYKITKIPTNFFRILLKFSWNFELSAFFPKCLNVLFRASQFLSNDQLRRTLYITSFIAQVKYNKKGYVQNLPKRKIKSGNHLKNLVKNISEKN